MSTFKDLIETFGSRIKNPILGSILFAFVVQNWKAVFYVIFSRVSVKDRFTFFDDNTTLLSLYLWPLVIGLSLAWALPRITFYGLKFTMKPQTKTKLLQADAAHEILTKKQEHSLERKKLQDAHDQQNERALEEKEKALIERHKRDNEISKIENESAQAELKHSITELRNLNKKQQGLATGISHGKVKLSPEEREQLKILYNRIERLNADLSKANNISDYSSEGLTLIEDKIFHAHDQVAKIKNK